MNDLVRLERLIADVAAEAAGSSRPVDVAAITRAATTQSPRWRVQPIFSGPQFLVAGAIVALFGGLLLVEMLPQPTDDRLPAVGASASAEAGPSGALAASLDPSVDFETDETPIRSDLVPGVDLVAEEVEPGVYRVISDGIRQVGEWTDGRRHVYVGLDDSVLIENVNDQRCPRQDATCLAYRLGDPENISLFDEKLSLNIHEVGPEGTVWGYAYVPGAAARDLRRWDGGRWQVEKSSGKGPARTDVREVAVDQNGAVLAIWNDHGQDGDGMLARLADDGWQVVNRSTNKWLTASHDGSVVLHGNDKGGIGRWNGRELEALGRSPRGLAEPIGVGNDGTLWWIQRDAEFRAFGLVRLMGSRVDAFEIPDGIRSATEATSVSADGSVWLGVADAGSDGGLYRFDGSSWSWYVPGIKVSSFDFARDGTIWLIGTEARTPGNPGDPESRLYAITPKAVAATQ